MSSPKITIIIVTWNSLRYIEDCLLSLVRQKYQDFSVIIIDNASVDGTVPFIREHFSQFSVLENFNNVGYARANNQGIKMAKSEYVLILNPDIILQDDFILSLITYADGCPQGGSFGGKLLRYSIQDLDPSERGGGLKTPLYLDIIDSLGLHMYKNRQVTNWGEGEKDNSQYEKPKEVFGVSGACVLYKMRALDDIMIHQEYFDQNFFSYKEDVDMAWRLKLYGWQNWYVPKAVGFHHRKYKNISTRKITDFIINRKHISWSLRYLSLRNHHLMLVKNEMPWHFFIDLPFIVWREIQITLYSLLFEPIIWIKAIISFFRLLPYTLMQRKIIMAHRKVGIKEMRKWFK